MVFVSSSNIKAQSVQNELKNKMQQLKYDLKMTDQDFSNLFTTLSLYNDSLVSVLNDSLTQREMKIKSMSKIQEHRKSYLSKSLTKEQLTIYESFEKSLQRISASQKRNTQ